VGNRMITLPMTSLRNVKS